MNTSDETKMSSAPKSEYLQTTLEDSALTLVNIKIPPHRLEKAEVEAAAPPPAAALSEGSAASVSEVKEAASSPILKIQRTIGGVKINVCIFQEPTPMPARPEEVVQK